MKMKIFKLTLIAILLLSVGCEEDFNPKTKFIENNVLSGVIRITNNYYKDTYTVWLSRFYDVDGYDPNINVVDPGISGAKIDFYHNNIIHAMREVKVPRTDTTRYKTVEVYYVSPLIELRPSDKITVKAETPDGDLLWGETNIPSIQFFDFSYPFNRGITTKLNRFLWGDEWKIQWRRKADGTVFSPRLILFYSVIKNGIKEFKSEQIPTEFIVENGKEIPALPTYTTDITISYEFDAMDSLMARISAGDTSKGDYYIHFINWELLEFDIHLSKYFASTRGYLDQFSIRLDESVYSNIKGGVGIIGSSMSTTYRFEVEKNWIEDFGYNHSP